MDYSAQHHALLTAMLGAAAASDVAQRRIPNVLSVAIVMGGLGAQYAGGGNVATALAVLGAICIGAAFVVPWKLGLVGGGDVKLAAAAAAWIGWDRLIPYLGAIAISGGVVSVLAVVTDSRAAASGPVSSRLAASLGRFAPTARRGITAPYGVAIATGALVSLWWLP